MAARLNNRHQKMVRDKIQTSQLINRLQDHVLGETELKPTQVDSAKYLINQAIGSPPSNTVISGDPENPLQTVNRIELVDLGSDSATPED